MSICKTRCLAWSAVAGLVAALLAVPGWSQVPGVPGTVKKGVEPAAGAVKGAVPKAAKGVKEAAKGAVDDVPKAADDTVKGARREGREAVREGRKAVREGVREARETVREGRDLAVENLRAADLGLWLSSRAGAEGLVIADVAAEGAIAKIGFQEGDRIVSINGTPVRSDAEFVRLLLADEIRSERAKVIVFRDGREQILYVEPALIYEEIVAYDPLWQYGLVIDDRYDDRLVILRVYPRTPAYYAGLRAGDVITSFGGQRIAAVADFTRALSSADGRVALQVNRANRTRALELDTSAAVEGRTRATLRPEIGAETEGRVEGRTKGRVEGRTEGKAKGRVEKQPTKEGEDEVPTPKPRLEKQPKVEKPDLEIPDAPAPAPKAPSVPKAAPKVPGVPKP